MLEKKLQEREVGLGARLVTCEVINKCHIVCLYEKEGVKYHHK